MLSRFSWLPALLAAVVSADGILPNLSFRGPYSAQYDYIEHFTLVSSGPPIKVHSDRIILTPPHPGGARSGIWSNEKTSAYDWEAELVFRANGPSSQPSGNLQVWAVDDTSVEANSVYTVSKFDGMVIVIDQYGGGGGKIRAFLNDGSKVYNTIPHIEGLAFGHCDYSYRNRGSYSALKITNHNGLTVSIDGKQCFHSDKIVLPPGQHFGITAATANNPDSFELNSFTVRSLGAMTHAERGQSGSNSAPAPATGHPIAEPHWQNFQNPNAGNTDPAQDPNQLVDHQRQFNDLHTRLQHIAGTLAGISSLFVEEEERSHNRHEAIMNNLAWGTDLQQLRTVVADMARNVEQTASKAASAAEKASAPGSATLSPAQIDEIKKAAKRASPSILTLALTMAAVQVILVGAFAVYTSRSSQPKKYL